MEKITQEKQTEIFLGIIELLKRGEHKLDMSCFIKIRGFEYRDCRIKDYPKVIQDCNTSCCIAGLIPLVDEDYARNFIEPINERLIIGDSKEYFCYDFKEMSGHLVNDFFDFGNTGKTWRWIFSKDWNDDADFAIKRIEYFIAHGKPPEEFNHVIFNSLTSDYLAYMKHSSLCKQQKKIKGEKNERV